MMIATARGNSGRLKNVECYGRPDRHRQFEEYSICCKVSSGGNLKEFILSVLNITVSLFPFFFFNF